MFQEELVYVRVATLFFVFSFSICESALAQLPVNRTLRIAGSVVDQNGAPIAQAQIFVVSSGRVLSSTSTGVDGNFEIHLGFRQPFTLIVKAAGFADHEQAFEPSSESRLQITLKTASPAAEVTVVAARIPTRLDQTVPSVVVLNATALNSTAAITLDDALRQVPGFSLFRRSGSRTANPTSQGVSLRGIGASGASRAIVQSDGIPLNDPFGGWVSWNRVPRESINQVEILSGGASHLYGSTALSGLIDISTKRAKENQISFSTSYGNQTTRNASLYASGIQRDWSASLSAEVFRTNGYIVVPEDQRGGVDTAAGSRYLVTNLKIERRLSEGANFFGSVSIFGESRTNGTPLQTNRTHMRQFVLGGQFASERLGSFIGRIYGGTQLFDQNFSAVSLDRNSEVLTRVQRVPTQVLALSGQWSKEIWNGHTFVVGSEAREVRGASDEIVFASGRASSLIGAGGRERIASIYFEDIFRFGGRLFINLGVRFDRWQNFKALSATRSVAPDSPTFTTRFADRSEDAISGHASAAYKLGANISAVMAFSRAFRSPTLNELYRSFRVGNVLTLANENLLAERLTGGEAGLRFAGWNNRFEVRSNFFWNEINRPVANVTLQTTPALIIRRRENLGRTQSRGLEVHSAYTLERNWHLSAGYLLSDSIVERFSVNDQLEGLRLPQVPRHQFTFQLRYFNPSFVKVAFQGRAASSQFDDDQNLFSLASYFNLDTLVARQINDKLELFLAVENIFNQRYEVGKTPQRTLGPPALLRIGLRVRLGSH